MTGRPWPLIDQMPPAVRRPSVNAVTAANTMANRKQLKLERAARRREDRSEDPAKTARLRALAGAGEVGQGRGGMTVAGVTADVFIEPNDMVSVTRAMPVLPS